MISDGHERKKKLWFLREVRHPIVLRIIDDSVTSPAMRYSLPISPKYDSPIFEALTLQLILGLLSYLILDGGTIARICGIALVAFWGGATVLIWRHPQSPTRMDIVLIRFGFLPLSVVAYFLVPFIWHLRGLQ